MFVCFFAYAMHHTIPNDVQQNWFKVKTNSEPFEMKTILMLICVLNHNNFFNQPGVDEMLYYFHIVFISVIVQYNDGIRKDPHADINQKYALLLDQSF